MINQQQKPSFPRNRGTLGSSWIYGLLSLPLMSTHRVNGEGQNVLSSFHILKDAQSSLLNDAQHILLAENTDGTGSNGTGGDGTGGNGTGGDGTGGDGTTGNGTTTTVEIKEGIPVTLIFDETGQVIGGSWAGATFRDRPIEFEYIVKFGIILGLIPPNPPAGTYNFVIPEDFFENLLLESPSTNTPPTTGEICLMVNDIVDGVTLSEQELVDMMILVGRGRNLLTEGMITDPDAGDTPTIRSINGNTTGFTTINGPDGLPMLGIIFNPEGEFLLFPLVDLNGKTQHEGLNALGENESFTVRVDIVVTDGNTDSTSTLKIVAKGVNDPPQAEDDEAITFAGQTIDIPVTKNDTDVEWQVLNVIGLSGIDLGGSAMRVAAWLGGPFDTVRYFSSPDQIPGIKDPGYFSLKLGEHTGTAKDEFWYTVQDEGLASDTATVRLTLRDPFWFNYGRDNPDRSLEHFTLDPSRHNLKLVNLPDLGLHTLCKAIWFEITDSQYNFTFYRGSSSEAKGAFSLNHVPIATPGSGPFPRIPFRLDTDTDLIPGFPVTYSFENVVFAYLGTLLHDVIIGTQEFTELLYGLSVDGREMFDDTLIGDLQYWQQFSYVGGLAIPTELNTTFSPDLLVGYGWNYGDVKEAHLGPGFQMITTRFGDDVIKAPPSIPLIQFEPDAGKFIRVETKFATDTFGDSGLFQWRIFTENLGDSYKGESSALWVLNDNGGIWEFNTHTRDNTVIFGNDWIENGTRVRGDVQNFTQFVASGQEIDVEGFNIIPAFGTIYTNSSSLPQISTKAEVTGQTIRFGDDMLTGTYDVFYGDSQEFNLTLLAGRVGAFGEETSVPSPVYFKSVVNFSDSIFRFGDDMATTTAGEAAPHALFDPLGNTLLLEAFGDSKTFEWILKAAPATYVGLAEAPSPTASNQIKFLNRSSEGMSYDLIPVLLDTFRFGDDKLVGVKNAVGDVETYKINFEAQGASVNFIRVALASVEQSNYINSSTLNGTGPTTNGATIFASNRIDVMDTITRFGNDEIRALNSSVDDFPGEYAGDVRNMSIVLKSGPVLGQSQVFGESLFLQPMPILNAESRVTFMNNQFLFGDDLIKGGGKLWGDLENLSFLLVPTLPLNGAGLPNGEGPGFLSPTGSFVDGSGTKFTFGRDHLHGKTTDDVFVGDLETLTMTDPFLLGSPFEPTFKLTFMGNIGRIDFINFMTGTPESDTLTVVDLLEQALLTELPGFFQYSGTYHNSTTNTNVTKYTTFTLPEDIFGFDITNPLGIGNDWIRDFRTVPYQSNKVIVEPDFLQFKGMGIDSFGDLPMPTFSAAMDGSVMLTFAGVPGSIAFQGYNFADYTSIQLVEGTPNGMGAHFAAHSSGVFATLKLENPLYFYLDDPDVPMDPRDLSGFDPFETGPLTPTLVDEQVTIFGVADENLTTHGLCKLVTFELVSIDPVGPLPFGDYYKMTVTNDMGTIIGMGTFDLPASSTFGTTIPFTLVGDTDSTTIFANLGTRGADTLFGFSPTNELFIGFGGDDIIVGGVGDNTVKPGAGNDAVTLGTGMSTLSYDLDLLGGAGNALGNDRVFGFNTNFDNLLDSGEDLLSFMNVGNHDGNGIPNQTTDLEAISLVKDNGMGNVLLEIYDQDILGDNSGTGAATQLLSLAFGGVAHSAGTDEITDVIAESAIV